MGRQGNQILMRVWTARITLQAQASQRDEREDQAYGCWSRTAREPRPASMRLGGAGASVGYGGRSGSRRRLAAVGVAAVLVPPRETKGHWEQAGTRRRRRLLPGPGAMHRKPLPTVQVATRWLFSPVVYCGNRRHSPQPRGGPGTRARTGTLAPRPHCPSPSTLGCRVTPRLFSVDTIMATRCLVAP